MSRHLALTRVILFVKDLAHMEAFYGHVLGLKPIPETRSHGWIELDAGGTRLALHAMPEEVASTITIDEPPKAREENPVKLVFHAHDVDAERARLIAAGVTMLPTKPWGACDGLDPEGNVF